MRSRDHQPDYLIHGSTLKSQLSWTRAIVAVDVVLLSMVTGQVQGSPTNSTLQDLATARALDVPIFTVRDRFERTLNQVGITLVDWEGQLANPVIRVSIRPPSDAVFPGTATLIANSPRVYFDNPSDVSGDGPTKSVAFGSADYQTSVGISIFPDRDTLDEDYLLTLAMPGTAGEITTFVPIHVIDQDKTPSYPFPIQVDFSRDQTGFFDDPAKRTIIQQAANDWFYFFDDMRLRQVPAIAESTWIWSSTSFFTGSYTTNSSTYVGFLLYSYGIHTSALRSGGEGSYAGGFQSSSGIRLPLRRSGGIEIETQGNYNSLGWFLTTDDNDWWKSGNYGNEPNDLYSIAHHEMGHAFMFNPAYPRLAQAKAAGRLEDPVIYAYQGDNPSIDAYDHLTGTIDQLSQRGAFGYEYYGNVPARRWLITKLDLLAAQALGYQLRSTSALIPLTLTKTGLPFGQPYVVYTDTALVTGGLPAYRVDIVSGALPPGLRLDSFSGVIKGTPTAPGVYDFTVRVLDADDRTPAISRAMRIAIVSMI